MQQATKEERIVNGVSVTQLFSTMDAIKEQPEMARFSFHASNRWQGAGANQTTINEYEGACQSFQRTEPFTLQKDEPPVLLGADTAPNPVEYVLAALAGCLTSSLVYHAAARGITIEAVESTYTGTADLRGFLGMDETVRNGYENIGITFKVKGNAPEETLQELVEIAQARSPVFDMITNKVPVTVTRQA